MESTNQKKLKTNKSYKKITMNMVFKLCPKFIGKQTKTILTFKKSYKSLCKTATQTNIIFFSIY